MTSKRPRSSEWNLFQKDGDDNEYAVCAIQGYKTRIKQCSSNTSKPSQASQDKTLQAVYIVLGIVLDSIDTGSKTTRNRIESNFCGIAHH